MILLVKTIILVIKIKQIILNKKKKIIKFFFSANKSYFLIKKNKKINYFIGTGSLLAAIKASSGKKTSLTAGKPNSYMLKLLLELQPELKNKKICMVGI